MVEQQGAPEDRGARQVIQESEPAPGALARTVTDGAGITWTFRVVVPARVERRRAERRTVAADGVTAERRAGVERRRERQLRVRLPEPYAQGWLLVESSTGERHRLAPIPPEWERLSETRLALLARVAGAPAAPDEEE